MTKKGKSKAASALNLKATKPKRPSKVKGKGDYVEATPSGISKALERIESKVETVLHPPKGSIGSTAGRALGSLLGQGDLGAMAGDALHKWFSGSGDYEITSNTLVPGTADFATSPPEFTKSGKRGTRIVEKEYLSDIFSPSVSGAFSNTSYRINPADPTTFPWLSTIAQNFEEYRINGIIFEFRTMSSTFNASGQALGTIIMATDYDVLDSPYTNKVQMENADYANSTVTSQSALHGVECDRNEMPTNLLYTAAFQPSTGDLRMYDHGLFQIAVFGVVGTNVNLGELWVSYDVTFYKKELVNGQIGSNIPYAIISSSNLNNSLTFSNPYSITPRVLGTFPLTIGGASNLTLFFPPRISAGYYFFTVFLQSSVTMTGISSWPSTASNCVVASQSYYSGLNTLFSPSFYNYWFPGNAQPGISNSGGIQLSYIIQVTGQNAKIDLPSWTGGTVTGSWIHVNQIPPPTTSAVNYITN